MLALITRRFKQNSLIRIAAHDCVGIGERAPGRTMVKLVKIAQLASHNLHGNQQSIKIRRRKADDFRPLTANMSFSTG